MGLEQAALNHGTGEEGTAWVDGDGWVFEKFAIGGIEGDGASLTVPGVLFGNMQLDTSGTKRNDNRRPEFFRKNAFVSRPLGMTPCDVEASRSLTTR